MVRVTEKSLAVYAVVALSAVGAAAAQNDPEAKFLEEAVRGDVAEVKMGELAQERGQSEGVRELGEMLVEDHSSAMKATAELAKDLNVIPPAQPTAEQTQKHDALARLSGEEFDRQFVAEMVKAHEEAVEKYEKHAESNLGDAKVREHAAELLPTLKEHLAMAQRLQQGGAASHDRHTN
jgi:putative membrane protein